MKKTYEKPLVVYEKFELSQNIAVCAWDVVDAQTAEACGAVGDTDLGSPDIIIFTGETESVCMYPSKDYEMDNGDSFCYTVSSDGWNIFNS